MCAHHVVQGVVLRGNAVLHWHRLRVQAQKGPHRYHCPRVGHGVCVCVCVCTHLCVSACTRACMCVHMCERVHMCEYVRCVSTRMWKTFMCIHTLSVYNAHHHATTRQVLTRCPTRSSGGSCLVRPHYTLRSSRACHVSCHSFLTLYAGSIHPARIGALLHYCTIAHSVHN